jgi:hypothetical protein
MAKRAAENRGNPDADLRSIAPASRRSCATLKSGTVLPMAHGWRIFAPHMAHLAFGVSHRSSEGSK